MRDKRHHLSSLFAIGSIVVFAGGCSKGDISNPREVVARVGDREITTAYFQRQVSDLPESVRILSNHQEGKAAILEALVNRELVYADALRKRIDKNAELRKKLADLRKELVITEYLQKEVAGKLMVTNSEIEAYYRENPGEFQRREEVRISQIIIDDQAKADEMMNKLHVHRDFGELATTYSIDRESAARKGDIGWFARSQLPPDVRSSIFSLRPGETSTPFRAADGYEIYTVTDRRVRCCPLDTVRDAIKAELLQQKFHKGVEVLVATLRKSTRVHVNEKLLHQGE